MTWGFIIVDSDARKELLGITANKDYTIECRYGSAKESKNLIKIRVSKQDNGEPQVLILYNEKVVDISTQIMPEISKDYKGSSGWYKP